MTETWKPIPGYNGDYEASDQGQIRSLKRSEPRVMRQNLRHSPKKRQYPAACFYKKGQPKRTQYIHTIVWWTFRGPVPLGHTIEHINGDTTDSRLSNLALKADEIA